MFIYLSHLENTAFWGNSLFDYLKTLGIFLASLPIIWIIYKIIIHKLSHLTKKTKTEIGDLILGIIKSINPLVYVFIAFYYSVNQLQLSNLTKEIFNAIMIIMVTYQVIRGLQAFINYFFKTITNKEKDPATKSVYEIINNILKAILWLLGILLILSNAGINITSLIAGLGIGGIAIALALQNILGDLLSSFAIYFDKPFVVGDFIIVGDKMGTVEKIGIKTTRLRALQGEELIFSNQNLIAAQIQNFKKMQERRCTFSFGVTYETESGKLKKIPDMIKKIIENTNEARFDRAHFFKFADSSLLFEVVYYVRTGDYNIYMDTQQIINFEIIDQFEKENISMAYPTQTIHLNQISAK